MAEQRSSRPGEPKGGRTPSDSHLRLVGADGQVVFDDAAPDTDESPTIISKAVRPPEPASMNSDGSTLRGRKLAHFELIEPIGVGGMAAVLRARDTQLDRFVALKILPPEMARDPENIRRFHQEARAAAKLDHENIARVFFCGEDQGLHFIAFEYVEGENLRVILERRGRIPVAEAIRYILQVATGLEHAASRSVVHRDVKPSNIIITPTGRAKLVDMGLARSLEPQADAGLTQSGVTLGTFDYISPEQALEPRDADSRSDLYSLGCTFYHVLTGHPPVPEGTAAKKLHHHQHVAPVDPRQINPDIPDEVAFIIGKLMAKNPRDRYQRPVLLVQHLMQVAQKFGAGHDLPEPLFVDVNLPADPGRRPLVFISLAALLLAGLLFLLSLVGTEPRHNVEPPPPMQPVPTPTAEITPPIVGAPAMTASGVIRDEKDLIAALERGASTPNQKLSLVISGTIKLSGLSIGDVVKAPNDIELTAAKPTTAQPTPAQFLFAPTGKKADYGLRIAGNRTVAFKGIAFEVGPERADRVDESINRFPSASVAAVAPAKVVFEMCRFSQRNLPLMKFIQNRPQDYPVASILLESLKDTNTYPDVKISDSWFANGQGGITMIGPYSGQVKLTDCGFSNVGTLFHARGGRPWIYMEHCSAFLRNGPAFRVDGDTSPKIMVETSLFCRPKNAERLGDEPNLIHTVGADSDPAKVRYFGKGCKGGNGYQGVLLLSQNGQRPIIDLEDFRIAIAGPDGDPKSVDPRSISFKETLPIFSNDGGPPAESEREPRPVDQFDTTNEIKPLVGLLKPHDVDGYPGLRKMLGARAHPAQFADVGPAEYQPKENEIVVDGSQDDPDTKLRSGIAAAKAKQEFLLKPGPKNEKFKLPLVLIRSDLTIRAHPDATSVPIVAVDEKALVEASLFRLLKGGSLTLKGIQLELDPGDDRFASLSLAEMAGGDTLTLDDCVVTLKGQDRDKAPTPLSVVTVQAPNEMAKMMPTPAMTPPKIVVQNSVVRGEGDLVTLRSSRPLELQVQNSLVYLQGSLVQQQQGAAKDPNGDLITIGISSSAIMTEGAMLRIQSGKGPMSRFQHPYRITSTDSLYARLRDQPLILLDVAEEKPVPDVVGWQTLPIKCGDAIVNFAPTDDPLVSVMAGENGIAPQSFDRKWWQEQYAKQADSVKFYPVDTIHPGGPLSAQEPEELVTPSVQTDPLLPYLRKKSDANP